MRGTEIELEEWGRWVRAGADSLGANSVFILGSTVPTAMITDERAVYIDQVVCRLINRDRTVGCAVKYYYTRNLTDEGLAKKIHTSKTRASYLRRTGVAWIDGLLSAQDEVCYGSGG